jgi:hypothetical protein
VKEISDFAGAEFSRKILVEKETQITELKERNALLAMDLFAAENTQKILQTNFENEINEKNEKIVQMEKLLEEERNRNQKMEEKIYMEQENSQKIIQELRESLDALTEENRELAESQKNLILYQEQLEYSQKYLEDEKKKNLELLQTIEKSEKNQAKKSCCAEEEQQWGSRKNKPKFGIGNRLKEFKGNKENLHETNEGRKKTNHESDDWFSVVYSSLWKK